MNYEIRQMQARSAMRHDGQEVAAGAMFYATAVDARYLTRHGRAVDVTDAMHQRTLSAVSAIAPNKSTASQSAGTDAGAGETNQAKAETTGSVADTPPAADSKPSTGLTVPQLKQALADRNIPIPEGVTLKADLAALLDGAGAS